MRVCLSFCNDSIWVLTKNRVHGLNLAVPEQAKAIVKPWHEREDTGEFADSGVDDQVWLFCPLRSVVLGGGGRGVGGANRLCDG